MLRYMSLLSLLLCVAIVSGSPSLAVEDGLFDEAGEGEFVLGPPKELLRSPGGRAELWDPEFKALRDARLAAARVTVEPQSLVIPNYADAPRLGYVLAGEACAGLVTPMGIRTNLGQLRTGDVFAVPRGWTAWLWNNQTDRPFSAVAVIDTSHNPSPSSSSSSQASIPVHLFRLMGAQKEGLGGILHGFSRDLLARAWGMEEQHVEHLLSGQKDTVFVKVKPGEAQLMAAELHSNAQQQQQKTAHAEGTAPPVNMLGWEVTYNLIDRGADIYSAQGGTVTAAIASKLPILKKIGLSALRVNLMPGAMVAPHWVANAAVMLYITRGSASLEMVHPDGRQAVKQQVNAGDSIVAPVGYAFALEAGNDGLEYIAFFAADHPDPGFLAGGNSVYKMIPLAPSEAAFNVDKEFLLKFRTKRLHDVLILPPLQQSDSDGSVSGASDGIKAWQEAWRSPQVLEEFGRTLKRVFSG